MPELPEVEVARRVLARVLEGATIERVDVLDRLVGDGADAVRGMRVARVERRGKRLRIGLATVGGARLREGAVVALFAHLGMSGRWVAVEADAALQPYERVRVVVRRGRRAQAAAVAYVDPRRLGRVRLAEREAKLWRALGPDALDDRIDVRALHAKLLGRSGPIKAALLDQALLAGVGNIHAVEALWRARIDPRTRADALSLADVRVLVRAIRSSLQHGLRAYERANEPRYVRDPDAPNPFRIYGHAGEPCPRCGTAIVKMVLAGRGTTYCPSCQRRLGR